MSLVPVDNNEIVVGKPMPWPLYDQQYNLLLFQGDPVRDDKHRTALLTKGAYHELTVETTPSKEASPSAQENPAPAAANEGPLNFTFDDLQLKVEDKLQLEPPSHLSHERMLVKVIGFLRGQSMLVTPPVAANGVKLQLIEGENVVIRSFSGENAFAFGCTVDKVCRLPYEYLHLSFPTQIEGLVIRKAARIKVRIITLVKESIPGAKEAVSAVISDLSTTGASIEARQPLGRKGDILSLEFKVSLHNIDIYLAIKGVIRSMPDSEDIQPDDIIYHGIEFQKLQPNDQIVLNSLIYQQLIENPHLRV